MQECKVAAGVQIVKAVLDELVGLAVTCWRISSVIPLLPFAIAASPFPNSVAFPAVRMVMSGSAAPAAAPDSFGISAADTTLNMITITNTIAIPMAFAEPDIFAKIANGWRYIVKHGLFYMRRRTCSKKYTHLFLAPAAPHLVH